MCESEIAARYKFRAYRNIRRLDIVIIPKRNLVSAAELASNTV